MKFFRLRFPYRGQVMATVLVLGICLAQVVVGCDRKTPAPTLANTPRIVCTYAPAMEIAFALRLHHYLVGIPQNTHHRALYRTLVPEIDQIAVVGGRMGGVNLETIVSLNPTLVISFAGMEGSRTQEKFAQLRIPCEALQMESLAQISTALQRIGERTQSLSQLKIVQAEMARVLSLVDQAFAKQPAQRPVTVYFATSRSFLTTHSQQMLQHEMIERAKAKDAVDVKIGGWVNISVEQLLNWNPDVIVVSREASYTLDELRADSRLKQLVAMRTNRLYQMPDPILPWDYPGPDVVLGILWLAQLCYPDSLKQIQLDQEKEQYYQTIYGHSYQKLATGIQPVGKK